jgi:hypothetical protein
MKGTAKGRVRLAVGLTQVKRLERIKSRHVPIGGKTGLFRANGSCAKSVQHRSLPWIGGPAMKLETAALALVVIFAVLWLGTLVTGLLAAVPFGVIGLIPVAIVLALLVEVIRQRLANKEDDYYDKNVDK